MKNAELKKQNHGLKIDKQAKKIYSLSQLGLVLDGVKKEKSVVHCHGCFDLLHVGHIKHFEAAKKFGEVLVVTVTPDRFVNKGPDRPFFNQQLRAEAIAALECVDYVAINEWPMAIETIKVLRPHFYVKGIEYKAQEKDVTGGIALEEKAVNSVGGELVFTDEKTFSSSNLLNRGMGLLDDNSKTFLNGFSERHNKDELEAYLAKAGDLKVLVLGETIIDEYQYTEALGKSSKDALLAVRTLSTERFAGGILAVANHMGEFCGEVDLMTTLGQDESYEQFILKSLHSNVTPHFFYRNDAPTIVKRRIIDQKNFTKLLQVYNMENEPPGDWYNKKVLRKLESMIGHYDMVVAVDFGHYFFSDEIIDFLCENSKFLAVNTQTNAGNTGYNTISKFKNADFVSLTEYEARIDQRDKDGDLMPVIEEIAQNLRPKTMTITQGKRGCAVWKDGKVEKIPAFNSDAKDLVGAGDTFLSVASLAAYLDAPAEVTGFLGNIAGSMAVSTIGHSKFLEKVPYLKYMGTLLK